MAAPHGAYLALPAGAVVFLALYVIVKVATYEQADDALRLQNKQAYLTALPQTATAESPDVVVILFDDLGFGDVGFTGNTSIRRRIWTSSRPTAC